MSKIVEEFLKEYLKREPYASREELISVLSEAEMIIRHNQDKSLEEIIEIFIKDEIPKYERIRQEYGVPGYTGSLQVGNIHVKLYGGNINYLGEELPSNALFDIASMTKFYTQIIAYNMIKDGYFRRSDKIKDLDSRFVNLGDLTIDEVLTFAASFKTDSDISSQKEVEEAKDALFHVKVLEKGKWNYNDFGLMIIKEVMEKVSNMSFEELFNQYVLKPLNLHDTHLIVPRSKFKLITGTPNASLGHINDMKANALGGFSGHAGVIASSDDLVRMAMGIRKKDVIPHLEDAYTSGKLNDAVGTIGNAYTSHPTGLKKSFVDLVETRDTFAIAGSTRVNLSSSSDSTFNILFNPSSMSVLEAKERVALINEKRAKKGLPPINPVREYEFKRDGQLLHYQLIDPRELLPLGEMESRVHDMAYLTLKLRFLDYLIRQYDKNYDKDIDVTIHQR